MNDNRPYAVEWIENPNHAPGGCIHPDIAKVELPFAVKQHLEELEDFVARASRDYQIICRFAQKFALKRGCSETVVTDIAKQLRLHVTRDAAFVRSFITTDKSLAAPVLDVLYEECVGNLPPCYRGGDLELSEPAPVKSSKITMKQLTLQYSAPPRVVKAKVNHGKPLCLTVPNPRNFTV